MLWASDFSNSIVQKNYLCGLTKNGGHFKTSKLDHLSLGPSQDFLITALGGSNVATWEATVLACM